MRLKINGDLMYGNYTENQIDKIAVEMQKPQEKRNYLFGIEFTQVNKVEVINEN
jgi:hypothetical protein